MNGTVRDTVQDSRGKSDLWPLFCFLSGTFRYDEAKWRCTTQYNYTEFAEFMYIYSHTFTENN
jgi:hypothetical protein